MSARYFQQSHNNENLSIKCNDASVKGKLFCTEAVESEGTLSLKSVLTFLPNAVANVSGKITLPAMSLTQQATSTGTNVTITGDPQQFAVETFDGSIAAGASASFSVFNTSCVAGKTLVLCSNDVSDNTLLNVNTFIAYQTNGAFIVTRHNLGSAPAAGKQKIIFKLIQSA